MMYCEARPTLKSLHSRPTPSHRVVPESPRWLLIQGRGEEAREVLGRLARGNGTQLPAAELKKPLSTGGEKVSMLDLFRGRNIRQRTVVLVISW